MRLGSSAIGGLEALAGVRLVFVRIMRDPNAVQEASLAEAERYAQLFEGWSDDLGIAESLTLIGTIRFWAGRLSLAEQGLERATDHASRVGSRSQEAEIARLLTLVISQGPTPVDEGLRRLEAIGERARGDRKVRGRCRDEARRARGDAGAVRAGTGADHASEGARS